MTPILQPLVVRFRNPRTAKRSGWRSAGYAVVSIVNPDLVILVKDDGKLHSVPMNKLEIINDCDFQFTKEELGI